MPSVPATTKSASSSIAGGPSSEAHANAEGVRDRALLLKLAERAEGVEVSDVIAGV